VTLCHLLDYSPSCSQEIASNFKDQGNDYFKGRKFREAQGFYTQGIDALTKEPIEGQRDAVKTIQVQDKNRSLYNALLLNRAAANLELGISPLLRPSRLLICRGFVCRKLWPGAERCAYCVRARSAFVQGALSGGARIKQAWSI
jgi:hypothetical protein